MVLLHIIFPQELFGLALQPPKQPNKMLTSRVCSDTSSIWCESVGIPRSHSSGSSWFVIWKKNCLNSSSKKQKLNSLGDVNCDVAMLHLNFIQLTYLRTEQLLRWDGKKTELLGRHGINEIRPVLTKYGSNCCMPFLKKIYLHWHLAARRSQRFEIWILSLLQWDWPKNRSLDCLVWGWHHHSICRKISQKWSDPKIILLVSCKEI